jgi:hypothetical protein
MMTIELNEILVKQGINPETVLVFRHCAREPELRKVLPWLAEERPRVFNAYQQAQSPKPEKALLRADYVASFIGHEPGKAIFAGLYKRGDVRPLTQEAYWKIPENMELRKFGMADDNRLSILWFDLELMETYVQWKGKLVITWPPPDRSYYRWANKNNFLIHSILQENALAADMPPWNRIVLTWDQLTVLPSSWKARLQEWRGIYLIFDASDGKSYVGSASGSENLLGRWLDYMNTGHGDNKNLKSRDRKYFNFCMLERVSPDMAPAELSQLEHAWMDRLHTRTHGLNE